MKRLFMPLALATLAAAAPPPRSVYPGKPIPAQTLGEVQRTVFSGPWAAWRGGAGGCPVIHILEARSCPFCRAFMKQEYLPLEKAGYDIRISYGAVASDSSAAIAEIALRRDIRVTLGHMGARPATGPDPANGDDDRLNAFNAAVMATQTYVKASRQAGYSAYLPTFIWQDKDGRWRLQSGYSPGDGQRIAQSMPTPAPGCAGGA